MPDGNYSVQYNLYICDDSRTQNTVKFKALLENLTNYLDNKRQEIITDNTTGYSFIFKKINPNIDGDGVDEETQRCYENEEDKQVQIQNDVTKPIKKYENRCLTQKFHHLSDVGQLTFIFTPDIDTPLLQPQFENKAISTMQNYNAPKNMAITYNSKIVIKLTNSTQTTFPMNITPNFRAEYLDLLNNGNYIMMTIASFNHENSSISEYTMILHKSELNLNDNKELVAIKNKEEWCEKQTLIMSVTNCKNKKMDVAANGVFYPVNSKNLKGKCTDNKITHFDNKDGIKNDEQLENGSPEHKKSEETSLLTSTNEPTGDAKIRIENDDKVLTMPNIKLSKMRKYWKLIAVGLIHICLLLTYLFLKPNE